MFLVLLAHRVAGRARVDLVLLIIDDRVVASTTLLESRLMLLEVCAVVLRADDSDKHDERSDDADEYTLHFRVVGHDADGPVGSGDRRLEVIASG